MLRYVIVVDYGKVIYVEVDFVRGSIENIGVEGVFVKF